MLGNFTKLRRMLCLSQVFQTFLFFVENQERKFFNFIKKARLVTTPIMTSLEKENFERESFQSFFLPIKNERISFKY